MSIIKIQRAFSASAKRYDLFSNLQQQIADELLMTVEGHNPAALLDVGCGTGYLTNVLQGRFPQTKMVGLDFAQGMLQVARLKNQTINWVLGDCQQLPFPDECFDIVVSNCAYQWSVDLNKAFKETNRVLKPAGVLSCTLFGFHTCQELFQSLQEARNGALQFTRLPDIVQVRRALSSSGFQNLKVESQLRKLMFNGMQELMAWLKSIGANHLSQEGYIGPEAFLRAASIYREKFPHQEGVEATFEVIQIYAKK